MALANCVALLMRMEHSDGGWNVMQNRIWNVILNTMQV